MHSKKKGISKNCIRSGLKEIDSDSYIATLRLLLEQKSEKLDEENIYVKRDKLSQYAIQKGYEPEIVWKLLRELLPDHR
jgi:regulatory protein